MRVVRDNSLNRNGSGINLRGETDAAANEIVGGATGIAVLSGSPTISDNTIRTNDQGLMVAVGATPVLSGNTICDNGTNLVVPEGAEAPDTTGNEICPDASG